MSAPDILPLCTTREVRGRRQIDGVWHVPIYCMNCHKQHGFGTEMDGPDPGYVGYLCDLCAEKWAPTVGLMLVPNEEHWRRVHEAQLERYGRELTPIEVAEQLKDGNSMLSKLLRSR